MGAVSSTGESVADDVHDSARVRDVTFAADGKGATVEVQIASTEKPARFMLTNNEGATLSDTHVGPGQTGRLVGQATGGRNNMVRVVLDEVTRGQSAFQIHVQAIPERH